MAYKPGSALYVLAEDNILPCITWYVMRFLRDCLLHIAVCAWH